MSCDGASECHGIGCIVMLCIAAALPARETQKHELQHGPFT